MFKYSATSLATLRCDAGPSPLIRRAILASGWEPHPREGRLFLMRREIRPVRLASAESVILPGGCDPVVMAALFG